MDEVRVVDPRLVGDRGSLRAVPDLADQGQRPGEVVPVAEDTDARVHVRAQLAPQCVQVLVADPRQDLPHAILGRLRPVLRQRGGSAQPGQRGRDPPPGDAAPDQALGGRVRAQPVRAVERDARGLARGPDAGHTCPAVDVRLDAAHRVVRDRADRDGLLDRVEPQELDRHLPDQGQAGVDAVGPEVGEVELEVLPTVGRLEAAPGEDLLGLGARHHVAGRQLHQPGGVVRHEALAPVVLQVAALAAARLGHEDAVRHQAGRVELQELHVLERQSGPVGHRHAVTGHGLGIGGEPVQAAAAARGDEQRLAADRQRLPRPGVDPDQTGEGAVAHDDVGDEQLVVAGEAAVPLQLVVEGLHLEEAGLVGRERRPGVAVTAEGALRDVAIGVPGPGDAPVIELVDLPGDRVDECPHDVLVGQEVRALHRVPRVQFAGVAQVLAQHRRGAALGAHGVRPHELHLGDDADVDAALEPPGDFDRGAQPGQPGPQDHHVMHELAIHREPHVGGRDAVCTAIVPCRRAPATCQRHRRARRRSLGGRASRRTRGDSTHSR